MVTSVRFPTNVYDILQKECESSGYVMRRLVSVILKQFFEAVKDDITLFIVMPSNMERVKQAVYIDDNLFKDINGYISKVKHLPNGIKLTKSIFIISAVIWYFNK